VSNIEKEVDDKESKEGEAKNKK